MSASRRWRIIGTLTLAALVMIAAFAATSAYCIRYYKIVHLGFRQMRSVLFAGDGPRAWRTILSTTLPGAFGWAGFIAVLAGVVRAVWKRRIADVVLLAFIVPTFTSMAGMTWVLPRYPLPLVAPLSILAADVSVRTLPKRRWFWILPLLALLTVPPLSRIVRYDMLASETDTRLEASAWVASHMAPHTRIAVCRGYGAPIINTDDRTPPAFDVTKVLPCSLAAIRATGARYVITQTHPDITGFFIPTDEARQWLEAHAKPLAVFSPYRSAQPVGLGSCFFGGDAFYIPYCGFENLTRGGPIVTIWDLD